MERTREELVWGVDMTSSAVRPMVLTCAVLAAAASSYGAGFALFEHGNKAMAMGGAFTAVADDPSAVFWNPAGLVRQEDRGVQLQGGFTLIHPVQDFAGASPYPGDGYTASQVSQVFPPIHLYAVVPLADGVVGAVGLISPFGLGSWWDDTYAGRFVSKRADMRTWELNPVISARLGERLSVAFGVRYMAVQVDLTRDIPVIDPYRQAAVAAGQVHLATDGLSNGAWGWNAGIMVDAGGGFSLGACYRSGIDVRIDDAEASFTQYSTGHPDFDTLLASLLPFGDNIPGESRIDYPDLLSLGVAWRGETWTVSAQWGRMGWSSFQELPLNFPTRPELSSAVPEQYHDSDQVRLGVEYRISSTWAVRGGLVRDETPQPARSMSPLLGDGTRTGASAGVGWSGEHVFVDAALFYLKLDERFTGLDQFDGYVGTYSGSALLGGATLGYRF